MLFFMNKPQEIFMMIERLFGVNRDFVCIQRDFVCFLKGVKIKKLNSISNKNYLFVTAPFFIYFALRINSNKCLQNTQQVMNESIE